MPWPVADRRPPLPRANLRPEGACPLGEESAARTRKCLSLKKHFPIAGQCHELVARNPITPTTVNGMICRVAGVRMLRGRYGYGWMIVA
jgi:hypothetical protein